MKTSLNARMHVTLPVIQRLPRGFERFGAVAKDEIGLEADMVLQRQIDRTPRFPRV